MRCESCNKFVGLELNDTPEEGGLTVSDDGTVTCDVRIVRTCTECGQELKEANFSVDVSFEAQITEHREGKPPDDHATLEVEWDGLTAVEEVQTTDRSGRVIRNPRYRKTMFGAEGTLRVMCQCGEVFTEDWKETIQASAMDEL